MWSGSGRQPKSVRAKSSFILFYHFEPKLSTGRSRRSRRWMTTASHTRTHKHLEERSQNKKYTATFVNWYYGQQFNGQNAENIYILAGGRTDRQTDRQTCTGRLTPNPSFHSSIHSFIHSANALHKLGWSCIWSFRFRLTYSITENDGKIKLKFMWLLRLQSSVRQSAIELQQLQRLLQLRKKLRNDSQVNQL